MELEDQVKFLMKSYEAPKPSSQVNKITSSCKFCSGPHETHNCMELPKRAFKEFASSRADKMEDRWPTTNRGPRNFGEAYEAWKDKPNFRGYQTQSVSLNDSSPLAWFEHYPPQNTPKQSYEEALRKFFLSQELQLSTLETRFRQQQADMNNKVSNMLNAINERNASKSTQAEEVKSVTIINHPTSHVKIKSPSKLFKHMSPKVKETKDHVNSSRPIHFVNTITTILAPKPDQNQQPTRDGGHEVEGEVSKKDHDVTKSPIDLPKDSITQGLSEWKESKEESEGTKENPGILDKSIMERLERDMVGISIRCRNRIEEGDSKVFKISCTTNKKLITDTYIDPNLHVNAIPLSLYNEAFPEKITCKELDNVRIMKRSSVMIGGFIYNIDLTMIDDIDSFINLTLTNLIIT
jgi:hypothetical protein